MRIEKAKSNFHQLSLSYCLPKGEATSTKPKVSCLSLTYKQALFFLKFQQAKPTQGCLEPRDKTSPFLQPTSYQISLAWKRGLSLPGHALLWARSCRDSKQPPALAASSPDLPWGGALKGLWVGLWSSREPGVQRESHLPLQQKECGGGEEKGHGNGSRRRAWRAVLPTV